MRKNCLKVVEQFNFDSQKLLTIGGEHSISYIPIKKYLESFDDLMIIHLDAHADLREAHLEDPHSHASIIRRVTHEMKSGHRLIQYGIRSGTKEEYTWMKEQNTLVISVDELLEALKDDRPYYLTLDLDFFDPAYFPGTGTPEAGGETFHSFIKIMKHLKGKNLVGADVTELAPMLDPTGNSSAFASKVLREVMLGLF